MEDQISAKPQGFSGQFQALADFLNGEKCEIVTAHDALHSIELVAAIYHSARIASVVHLPLKRSVEICADWKPAPN